MSDTIFYTRLAKLACMMSAVAGTLCVSLLYGAEPILLKAGTILPDKNGTMSPMRIKTTSQQSEKTADRGLYIIQHDGIITPGWRRQLEEAGAVLRGYIPENAYLIEADKASYVKIVNSVEYTYLGEYVPEYRLSQMALDFSRTKKVLSVSGAKKTSDEDVVRVFSVCLFSRDSTRGVSERVAAMKGCCVIASDGSVVRCALTAAGVTAVSSLPDVAWVEEWHEPKTKNNDSVKDVMMNVETVWPEGDTGLDLTGKGQVVAVADSGLSTGDKATLHRDIRGRVTRVYARGTLETPTGHGHVRYVERSDWKDLDGHGTHIVGSVLGNGTMSSDPKIRGVAYESSLIFQSCGVTNTVTGETDGICTPSDLKVLFEEVYTNAADGAGARIHSNSWGSSGTEYDVDARAVDEFIFNHPDMLILFAAGNDGEDANKDGVVDLGALDCTATAKNGIAVGASEKCWEESFSVLYVADSLSFPVYPLKDDAAVGQLEGKGLARFSSRGPCRDGRIKPDIVAPGTCVLSLRNEGSEDSVFNRTYGSDKLYAYLSGTSVATPLVAGSLSLMRQWLAEKKGIANPDGATVKALMMAGARSLYPGQYGTGEYQEIPESYPNNVEGWGLVDLGRTVQNPRGIIVYDAKVIAQGDSWAFKVRATAGSPLTIVMAYADAPAELSSSKQLVNDLDLLVQSPSGITYYPNSLDGPDRLNNVEGVRLSAADVETGAYTITVIGHKISMPMPLELTGGEDGACRYSLVVNGASESTSPDREYKKSYVSFDPCGGWPMPEVRVFEGTSSALGSLPAATWDGCTLLGWFTDPEGGERVSAATPVTGDMALYAHWRANSPTAPTWKIVGGVLQGVVLNGETDVVVPDAVHEIGAAAFGWLNVSSAVIPPSVTNVGNSAFESCTSLRRVVVGANVKFLGEDVFKNCENLKQVYYLGDEPHVQSGDPNLGGAYCNTPADLVSYVRRESSGWTNEAGELLSAWPTNGNPRSLARWDHSATFDANGGTGAMMIQAFTDGVVQPLDPNVFTREGWMFAGWAKSADGNVVYEDGQSITLTGDAVLYAKWITENTITYEPGANGTGTRQTVAKTNDVALTLAGAMFTRTGYTQTGWTANEVDAKVYDLGASYTANADITFYPLWTANTYTVTFNANGGTVSQAAKTVTYDSTYGDLPVPEWFGYAFDGWFTAASGGTKIVSTTNVEITEVQPLYAHWTAAPEIYMVTYAPGPYGVGSRQTATKTNDVALTLAGAMFTRTGYAQTGWMTNEVGAKVYDLGASCTANADITLYPFWTANMYTVTFNADGGEGGWSHEMEYGSAIVAPTVTRTGYKFCEWGPDVVATVPPSNVTYTARWEINQYAVTLDLGGGTGEAGTTLTHGMRVGDIPRPTRIGYSFDGWWSAVDGGERVPDDTAVTGDMSLYAHWTKDRLWPEVVGPVSANVAIAYDGYLYDGNGNVKGTIQVKVGKPNKKTGLAAVKATVVGLDGKKLTFKAAGKGKVEIAKAGSTEVVFAGGKACTVVLGANGMSGKYGTYDIDGALNVFTSKDAAAKSVAAAVLGKWQGAVNVAWREDATGRVPPYHTLSVSIAAKGKAKVSGTLANGAKVTANGQLVAGAEWCCVPVVVSKKAQLAFNVWLPKTATGAALPVVVGLGADVKVGKPGTLKAGAEFRVGTPLGENPFALKITYKAKAGTFKGSFKAHLDVSGRSKATKVNVAGVLVNGVGYGTATVKGGASAPVTIE